MAIIDGYQGVIYTTVDRETRIDLYTSDVWEKPNEVLDEFRKERWGIMNILKENSDQYTDFDDEDRDSVEEHSPRFLDMIDDFQSDLKPDGGGEDDYGDIHMNVNRVWVHLPWLTDVDAARRFGIPVPRVHGEQ